MNIFDYIDNDSKGVIQQDSVLPKDFFLKNLQYFQKQKDGSIDKSMISRLGFFPTSLWKPDINITKFLKKEINDICQTRKTLNSSRSDRRNGVNGGKCSVFNPHLAQMILSAYCNPHSNIYDPFGGGGTRGYIATKMGHNYTGVEIRYEEVQRIKKQMQEWGVYFTLINEDSTKYINKENYDFCYTCPPYYDLELYSEIPNDLSNAKTYEEYLVLLKLVLENTFYSLKDNSFAIFVVGNFRNKKGELEHLNGDLVKIAKEVGFVLWDELIWQGASNVVLTRCGKFAKNRKSVRMHEYIIVLKKASN